MIARFFPIKIRDERGRGCGASDEEEEEETKKKKKKEEEEEKTRGYKRSSIYHPPERIEVNHPERLERREEFKFYQGARKTRKINYHS